MSKHKVLFVNHVGALAGAEYCCLAIASAYRETSKMLLLEDGPFHKVLKDEGVKVNVIPTPKSLLNIRTSSGLNSLTALPALWQTAQQIAHTAKGFDILYANSQKAFIAAGLATFIGTPPLVWHLRDIMTAKHFSAVNRRIAITLANLRAAQVWVASQATADAFVLAGGRQELVKVMYDGIASDRFDRVSVDEIDSVRQELRIRDQPLVGLFSRLSYWKGQHVLLEALRELPNVHGLFVGKELFGEDEYVAKIQALASVPELVNRVHWLGFREDIPALMRACDIVIHASTEPEPCARIAVEGQLAQRPVIASNAGGMPEIIEDGVTGCLVSPGDAKALASTIQKLFNNPDIAHRIAQQGQKSAQTKFSPSRCLGELDKTMESLIQPIA
jgi:glycosyltransferase involved in cell wall biosynthesis